MQMIFLNRKKKKKKLSWLCVVENELANCVLKQIIQSVLSVEALSVVMHLMSEAVLVKD